LYVYKAYPTKKDEPIIIIPKTSSDIEIEKVLFKINHYFSSIYLQAFMMLKEGEKELRNHNLTQCAALADAFLWAQRERENIKNEFQEQMGISSFVSKQNRLFIFRQITRITFERSCGTL
jgi:hypothetical protein